MKCPKKGQGMGVGFPPSARDRAPSFDLGKDLGDPLGDES